MKTNHWFLYIFILTTILKIGHPPDPVFPVLLVGLLVSLFFLTFLLTTLYTQHLTSVTTIAPLSPCMRPTLSVQNKSHPDTPQGHVIKNYVMMTTGSGEGEGGGGPEKTVIISGIDEGNIVGWFAVTSGVKKGERIEIRGKDIVIGRKNCDIEMGDMTVSNPHARLKISGKKVIIIDLASRNGTYINGKRIQKAHLKAGDEVVMGETKMIFRIYSESGIGE